MAEVENECWIVIRGMEVLVEPHGDSLTLCSQSTARAVGEAPIFVARNEGKTYFVARPKAEAALPEGTAFSPVRPLFAILPEPVLALVGRAIACLEFEETHRFCGRCGTLTEPQAVLQTGQDASAIERARVCKSCSLTFHPRIPPAVIVLVERGQQLLLARGANFPVGRFSAVAGFVEIGESLEEAARREVREEVGVEISQLRYFGSQPWPFGHSLMIAFHAQYASGELRADGVEIVEAGWFERNALPFLPPSLSIARQMIDAFLTRKTS